MEYAVNVDISESEVAAGCLVLALKMKGIKVLHMLDLITIFLFLCFRGLVQPSLTTVGMSCQASAVW